MGFETCPQCHQSLYILISEAQLYGGEWQTLYIVELYNVYVGGGLYEETSLLLLATVVCCSIHESLSVISGHAVHAHGGHRQNEP